MMAGVVAARLRQTVGETQLWEETDLAIGAFGPEVERVTRAVCGNRLLVGDRRRYRGEGAQEVARELGCVHCGCATPCSWSHVCIY